MLAAKTSLGTRVDALGEDVTAELGIEHKATLEARLKMLEEGFVSFWWSLHVGLNFEISSN